MCKLYAFMVWCACSCNQEPLTGCMGDAEKLEQVQELRLYQLQLQDTKVVMLVPFFRLSCCRHLLRAEDVRTAADILRLLPHAVHKPS